MKYNLLLFLSFTLSQFLNGQESNSTSQSPTQPEPSAVLPSDFFAGALADAQSSEDELGTQRLVEVKSSKLTPSLSLSSSFKYVNNPLKNSVITRPRDGTILDLSLMFMLGLGEYGIGDDIISTPSLMLMHMRSYNDPVKDIGDQRIYDLDVDVQIAALTVPFVLPDDYTFSIGSNYVRVLEFRDNNKQMLFSNTPNISLSKIIPLENGDVVSVSTGCSYTFSAGDTQEETLLSQGVLRSIIANIEAESAGASPFNLLNGITHSASISYIKTLTDKLTLTPAFNYSKMYYDKGSNDGREDTTYIAGVTASYTITDWLNLTTLANFTSKETNGDLSPEFKDVASGFTIAVNHSF